MRDRIEPEAPPFAADAAGANVAGANVAPASPTFLQQAHRNNWQRYLESLAPGSRAGWDLVVLTAADERQAAVGRRQLEWRAEAGLLPPQTEFIVLADPPGARVGSGGATLRALAVTTPRRPDPTARRTLIIHSGADVRRLPHCATLGKLFARIPRTLPDGRASTVFDEFLISLSGLAGILPPGALIAAGDVLLVFDHLQLSFRRGGVTGVAISAPAEAGLRRGVFVSEPGTRRLRAYLHKPTAAELAQWDAVERGRVQVDTGLAWLDSDTTRLMLELGQEAPVAATTLNLYGDLLRPLAQSTERDAYLVGASDDPAKPALRTARTLVWDRLRGVPLTVERLQPAVFVDFKNAAEYYTVVAADPTLAALSGWEPRA